MNHITHQHGDYKEFARFVCYAQAAAHLHRDGSPQRPGRVRPVVVKLQRDGGYLGVGAVGPHDGPQPGPLAHPLHHAVHREVVEAHVLGAEGQAVQPKGDRLLVRPAAAGGVGCGVLSGMIGSASTGQAAIGLRQAGP